ncbi:unnamed protein product [marine sediment metagenome]|uniref:Uncharacterized protein n=1 Tax=marine sediment metagenome TaxID=412755 RepID=X1JT71_9ZZZZ
MPDVKVEFGQLVAEAAWQFASLVARTNHKQGEIENDWNQTWPEINRNLTAAGAKLNQLYRLAEAVRIQTSIKEILKNLKPTLAPIRGEGYA